ncbi:MAG: diphthine synthase [Thaumarchaeota archaeon]|nr:diphthine synthase [Nitrososphaerota archaeon]
MLYFAGLGIEQSLTLKSVFAMKKCEKIYYETYTSPVINEAVQKELFEQFGASRVELVKRTFVEDGRKILETASHADTALICSGDPMIATTHQELRTRAIKGGIATTIIHGSSIITAVGGEFGLHSYNFGRMVTMTREPMQYTAYNTIFNNLLKDLHSTVLLEWDEASDFFLDPNSAVKSLLESEKDLKQEVFDPDSLVLIASRVGTDSSKLSALTFHDLEIADLGKPPHILVIPGKLHFTELEALSAILGRNAGTFRDNSAKISRISQRMVTKYSTKTIKALARAKDAAAHSEHKINFVDIFENVECYTRDAERFLNEGKEELAVLSIGYAEGLLDSLRFGGQLEFEW